MRTIDFCLMRKQKRIELTERHIVEAPDERVKISSIDLYKDFHAKHERYMSY